MMSLSMESSNALAALINRIASGVDIDIKPSKGTSHLISITHEEKSIQFVFDQGGRVPDAADCISALWARSAVIYRGEVEFYLTFHKKAYEDSLTDKDKPLLKEHIAHYQEWKRSAEDAWGVFGDWFGRRWE